MTVTEDSRRAASIWTRLYARRNGFPQVVHSSKRFAGPTGLEEYVGYGVGMALTVYVENGALIFRSRELLPRSSSARRLAPAGMALPRRALRHPCRARRRQVQLHARDHPSRGSACSSARWPSSGRRTHDVPCSGPLIAIQIAMAAFDTIYHHELTERLAWRPSQRHELDAARARATCSMPCCSSCSASSSRTACWAILVMAVLAVEVVITLVDFVEEDMSRKLPASERVNHTLLAINYGAILALAVPVLVGWASEPTAIVRLVRHLQRADGRSRPSASSSSACATSPPRGARSACVVAARRSW